MSTPPPRPAPLSGRAPSFDRLRTALACGQPDCVPALELFHDFEVKEAFLGRPLKTFGDDVAFHYAAGYDYYSAWIGYRDLRLEIAARLHREETQTGAAYATERMRQWAPEHGGLISSLADFEAFPWPDPTTGVVELRSGRIDPLPLEEALSEVQGALHDGMGLILCTDGIFERFTKDLMGYEVYCYKLRDEPELIGRMFAHVGMLWAALYERAAALPQIGALWLADDIAFGQGLLFNPSIMREHLFPWYRRIGEAAARHKKPLLFHSDGDLRPILKDLIDCGIQAIQPIEPKAMDIAELKRDYAGRLCLVGNIDLGSTLTMGTPEDVRAEVRQRILAIGPGGGYCVGSSNSVTNYVPLANFIAMLEATFDHGCYPLR